MENTRKNKKQKRIQTKFILALFLAMACSMCFAQAVSAACAEPGAVRQVAGNEGGQGVTGLVFQDGHYVLYIEGVQVEEQGWQEISGEKFYVTEQGTVTERMKDYGGKWRYYIYRPDTGQWERQKDTWRTAAGKRYYFSPYGNCTRIYDPGTGTCQKYAGGGMVPVKNEICVLNNGKLYYFDSRGVRATQKGWEKISSREYVEIGKHGAVVSRMEKPGALWSCFQYDYSRDQWIKQKDVWAKAFGKEYYFSPHGNCTKLYDSQTKKCRQYKKGNMVFVKKDMVKLSNGRLYYFDAQGIRVEKKGWEKVSGKKYVEIGKKGSVSAKLEINGKGLWQYFKYDPHTEQWEKQKDVWKTVDNRRYYFSKWGNCIRIYHILTRECYDLSGGKMVLVRNAVREIKGKMYHFGPDGVMVSSPGLYLTASGQLIYTAASGRVVKEIPGQVLEYQSQDGKIISCRVLDANYMCYYDSDGNLRRRIDQNAPMVALTYDDGPSQYTPVILDVLRQYGGAATFFVVGERVAAYADTVRDAYGIGCEVGNHTYSHKTLTGASAAEIQNQAASTNGAVQGITGAPPAVLRPPGGAYNEAVKNAVGMPLVLWSIDTRDWKTRNAASTQAAVLNHVTDGDIVLMHDLYSQTAEASRTIIPELVRRGYQLVTVSELADCRGGMVNGGVYRAFRR